MRRPAARRRKPLRANSPRLETEMKHEALRHEIVARCIEMNARGINQGTSGNIDRKSTRLNSSHIQKSRMPSSA